MFQVDKKINLQILNQIINLFLIYKTIRIVNYLDMIVQINVVIRKEVLVRVKDYQ